ncbi:MAG: hypothetical protein HKN12_11945, partial [Gemmatimonadetes bacterium]|nr:hypothetical protein [Gemmatimonadota bacterium]
MMRRSALAAVAVAMIGTGFPVPAGAVDLGDGLIHLRNGTYAVADGPSSASPGRAVTALPPDERTTWIVALHGPSDDEARGRIEAAGARIVSAVPSNAWLVRARPGSADALRTLDVVARVDHYRDAWKISPDVGRHVPADLARRALAPRRLLDVHVFDGESAEDAARAAADRGIRVIAVFGADRGNRFTAVADAAEMNGLAALSAVEWIEEQGEI